MYSSTESWTKVVDWWIGVRTAPVAGSGVTPAWIWSVRNPMGRIVVGPPGSVCVGRQGVSIYARSTLTEHSFSPPAGFEQRAYAVVEVLGEHLPGESERHITEGGGRVVTPSISFEVRLACVIVAAVDL